VEQLQSSEMKVEPPASFYIRMAEDVLALAVDCDVKGKLFLVDGFAFQNCLLQLAKGAHLAVGCQWRACATELVDSFAIAYLRLGQYGRAIAAYHTSWYTSALPSSAE
jgi:hypothetical protein